MDPQRSQKIWRRLIILICFLGALIEFRPAMAAEKDSVPVAILKYSAGLASAVFIHEGSHALVAGVTNTDLTWEIGNYNQPLGFTAYPTSDAKGVAIYSSGLIAQVIGSEIVLQADGIDKNDAFIRGMMT